MLIKFIILIFFFKLWKAISFFWPARRATSDSCKHNICIIYAQGHWLLLYIYCGIYIWRHWHVLPTNFARKFPNVINFQNTFKKQSKIFPNQFVGHKKPNFRTEAMSLERCWWSAQRIDTDREIERVSNWKYLSPDKLKRNNTLEILERKYDQNI